MFSCSPCQSWAIIPRSFGIEEESGRLALADKRVPGGHFTLASNLFCEADEVKIYETFQPYRSEESLLAADGKRIIRQLCNTHNDITVSCVNVAEQVESECGMLSVALAVHLCFFAPTENKIYNNILNVRSTFLDCLKQNSLSYFQMSTRDVNNAEILFSYKI